MPVAATVNVAVAGAVTVTLDGWVVMLGATDGSVSVTVTVLEVVDTPLVSVALAVKV